MIYFNRDQVSHGKA